MKRKIKPGDTYQTKRFGVVEVVKYHSSKSIDVLFLNTNTPSTVRADHLRSGLIKDPSLRIPKDMQPGSKHKTNNYGVVEVISQHGCNDVVVRFVDTGYTCSVAYDNLIRGKIKDKLSPSVHGVGFPGAGDYSPSINNDAYGRWCDMLERCYSKNQDEYHPTYSECTVCEEWHNFQNFAKWYYKNHPMNGRKYAIDKDLKVLGNKLYSPDMCLFVSQSVNNFLCDSRANRGSTMIGVSYFKRDGNYEGYCNNPFTGKKDRIGYYNTELEAHMAWRRAKSVMAERLASEQCNDEVKNGLIRYKLAIDNNEVQAY